MLTVKSSAHRIVLVAIATLAAFPVFSAEPIARLESDADRLWGMDKRAQARPLYLRAATARMAVEAESVAAAKRLDLPLESDSLGGGDDMSDMFASSDGGAPSMSSTLSAREADGRVLNLLAAAKDYDRAAKPRLCDDALLKIVALKGMSANVLKDVEAFKAQLAKDRDPTELDPAPYVTPDYNAKKNEALKKAEAAEESGANASVLAGLWSEYGYSCFRAFDPEGARKAKAKVAALKMRPSVYPSQWLNAVVAYDNFSKFPLKEEEIRFPQALSDFGVHEKLVSIAGELDWDAENATQCIQDALDDGATTVVLENRGQPWLVKTIVMKSNQRLLLKKGVKVLQDRVSVQIKEKCPMILVQGVENVIIEGEGDNYIGKFSSLDERNKFSNDYGGDGILIASSRNVLVKNITLGANTQDGVCLGGMGADTQNVFIDNVVLENNYRQAMSVCNVMGLYCRKVTFANTIGGDPMCGIDFEPTYETEANSDCYFFDCTFKDNAGAAVNWSSSSYYPVTAYFKRCHFQPQRNYQQIAIFARCGIYMGPNIKAPGHIIFEDCDMETRLSSVPVKIDNSNLFDVTIKNFKVKQLPANADEPGNSPVVVNLAREYRYACNWKDYDKSGTLAIEGMDVDGFEGYDFLQFRDFTGGYSVENIKGNATMNGKAIDLSKYAYTAPEKNIEEPLKFDPAKFLPPANAKADTPDELPRTFSFEYGGAWFDPRPVYRALYFEDGAWKMMKIQEGVRELGLAGKPVAYYFRGGAYAQLKLSVPKETASRLYFELPPGGAVCKMRAIGTGTLRDSNGNLVKEFKWQPQGLQYAEMKPVSDKGEIWSLETTGWMTIKFFGPMYPIVAEDPSYLPRIAAQ